MGTLWLHGRFPSHLHMKGSLARSAATGMQTTLTQQAHNPSSTVAGSRLALPEVAAGHGLESNRCVHECVCLSILRPGTMGHGGHAWAWVHAPGGSLTEPETDQRPIYLLLGLVATVRFRPKAASL